VNAGQRPNLMSRDNVISGAIATYEDRWTVPVRLAYAECPQSRQVANDEDHRHGFHRTPAGNAAKTYLHSNATTSRNMLSAWTRT